MIVSLIVAASENNVIGRNNDLPWHLPNDMKFFREKTAGHPIIMGRKNYESIGRPLPKRTNIIVTRDSTYEANGCLIASSLEEAILFAKKDGTEEIFVIGGGEIYKQAMELANRIYLTRVHAEVEGDVYFPEIDPDVWEEVERTEHEADSTHKYAFTFLTFKCRDRLHLS